MPDYATQFEYNDYYQDVINQHIESEVLRRTATLREDHEKLQQKYNKLYDVANNYYQNYVLNGS